MIPWKLLAETTLPGEELMSLHQRNDEFVIRVNGVELMNSRMHGSEDALGRLGCAEIAGKAAPAVLVGGLGMGFTLAAALEVLPEDAQVVVAELVPSVVAWNRGPLAGLNAHALDDSRVEIYEGEVADRIAGAADGFNAILLDVDNGPEGLTQTKNDRLYEPAGLLAAHRALRKDGVLVIWSATQDGKFTARLNRSGFKASSVPVYAHGNRGRRHFLWFAKRLG